MKRQRPTRNGRHERWVQLIGFSILGGILLGLFIDKWSQPLVYVKVAEAATTTPPVVLIELDYSSKESIEKLIRATFPEEPNTAVAVAKCESGLVKDAQSHFILSYGREQSYGIFQIHAKDWDAKAKKLGYSDYKTDVEDNVKMARHLYKARGNFKDWSCYNNGSYKKYL